MEDNSNKIIVVAAVNFMRDELLDSSSPSSSEDEYIYLKDRNHHPRIQNYVENVVQQYSSEEFRKNFRVSRESAYYLVDRYERSKLFSERIYQGGRKQNSPETEILSFLWFSVNKNSYREICNIFNMSYSTFYYILNKIMNFLVDDIAPEVIKFPTDDDAKEAIAIEFAKVSGFPNVLGCIDGSYISIRNPKHKIRSTYVNRHDCPSITMQGICDAKLRFLDVYTGVPSKIHDSRIFKLSFISKEIPAICNSKYHLLGDGAYPIREYLLTPYRDYGNLRGAERTYNLKFCQTRVKIENAFGMLKGRFRQLMRLDFHNVETMAKFILACCTLHNICIDREDLWEIKEPLEEMVVTEDFIDDPKEILFYQTGTKKKGYHKNVVKFTKISFFITK